MICTRFGEFVIVVGFDPETREVLGHHGVESGKEAPVLRWKLEELVADGGPHEIFAWASAAMNVIQRCRECGCTDEQGCEGGCFWADWDLCSVCAGQGRERYIDATRLSWEEGPDGEAR